jgi:predicted DNA-binding protein YlxM (UPF0122 family)
MIKVHQEDINKLKSELPRGYTKKLAHKFNISKQAVSQHINTGNIENEVFAAALEMRQHHVREMKRRQDQLTEMI